MGITAPLTVRLATEADIPQALEIFARAREYMRMQGNPSQWENGYPDEEVLLNDIANGWLHCVCEEGAPDAPCGMFALIAGDDPTYARIYEGAWKNDSPYATIHRVASDGTHSGVFSAALNFARNTYDHLRIDTHKDNVPMQKCIRKAGFEYCGIIFIDDGTPRLAFEWTDADAV